MSGIHHDNAFQEEGGF